jgi:ligand-binding SRPBCC domain-containing protein
MRLVFSSSLTAPVEAVWAHASGLAGINRELSPLCMSGGDDLRLDAHTPLGVPLLRSVLSLGRILPFDLHTLVLAEVWPGRGFHESSHSVLQRRWEHRRELTPTPTGGTQVTDTLDFEPRVFSGVAGALVRRVFERRHRWLKARFGAEE